MTLRLVFMGTPDFSVRTLAEIIGQGHEIAAVYSQPPRAGGRGMALRKSPVHVFAEQAGMPVLTPTTLKSREAQAIFASHEADAAVVVAYGLILPRAILGAPREGCFNVHASLLPRWRGAAPIQRAIMAGDRESGVSIMRMDEGLDTGPVCMLDKITIGANMTADELHDELARCGGDLMIRALGALSRGALSCKAQDEAGVTYAHKIDKAEARIDWARPDGEVHNHIRGLSRFPGAWCQMMIADKMERIKVLRSEPADGSGTPGALLYDNLTVACGQGAVRITQLQRAGKSAMGAAEFMRGAGLSVGDRVD